MKARIVKVTAPNGHVSYTIEQPHFLFRWWWVPAWINSWDGANCRDSFSTLAEARENMCWFDGTSHHRSLVE